MIPFSIKFVAPAQAGAYLAPQSQTTNAIGYSLRWSDGVCVNRDLPLTPLAFAARWMLKQVQHDEGRSISLRSLRLFVKPNTRRPSAGWGLSRLSIGRGANWQDAIGSSFRWSDGEVSARTKSTRT